MTMISSSSVWTVLFLAAWMPATRCLLWARLRSFLAALTVMVSLVRLHLSHESCSIGCSHLHCAQYHPFDLFGLKRSELFLLLLEEVRFPAALEEERHEPSALLLLAIGPVKAMLAFGLAVV